MDDVSTLVGDHHGTAGLSITNVSATTTHRYSTPFGDTRGTTPATWTGDHGFLDKPEDTTGLTAIGARYYDPDLGRFISVDPVMDPSDPQQWHGYAYSNNNPSLGPTPQGCGGKPSRSTTASRPVLSLRRGTPQMVSSAGLHAATRPATGSQMVVNSKTPTSATELATNSSKP
ncbi:RHS repeat-associated core domain-containing protein [Isoptericola halotolerans]|uniref:RHS repeat-associated core domain-containing protein n=1 Tax=Isoptericola halotolerans TaxID=300560 RepID=UPI00388D3AD2